MGNLVGALKIAHGTADANAPFSNTMRMMDALGIRCCAKIQLFVGERVFDQLRYRRGLTSTT